MIARQARHPRLGIQDEHAVLGQVHGRADDGDLGGAVGETRGRIGEVELDGFHPDERIGGLEVADQPEQQVGARTDEVADPQHTAAGPRQHDQVVHHRVDTGQGLPHLGQPRRAEIGQPDLAGVAPEQHDAELLLELFDRCRQRGLGDEQFLRRPPIVQLLAEDGEIPQLAQRHVDGRDGPPTCSRTV